MVGGVPASDHWGVRGPTATLTRRERCRFVRAHAVPAADERRDDAARAIEPLGAEVAPLVRKELAQAAPNTLV